MYKKYRKMVVLFNTTIILRTIKYVTIQWTKVIKDSGLYKNFENCFILAARSIQPM